jgi:glycosyltransferase involved in cell wall biosynthesis
LLKKLKNSKLVFDIGDLWPESVIQLGYLKNKNAIKISKILEKWIYKRSDYINITTKKTIEWFQNQFPDIKSINFVPNFVDTDSIFKLEKNDQLVNKLNLQNKTIFGYAGNIGSAQGVKIILEAAELTIDQKEIIYLIIGDGVDRPILQDILEKKKLTNVLLLPPISKEDLLSYISLFDVAIIPLIKIDLFKMTIPSKLYESMSAETPVLLCVDGEARKILEESNCGYYVEPENNIALAEMIVKLYKNKSMLAELGKNGRIAAEKFYSKAVVVQNFFKVITK